MLTINRTSAALLLMLLGSLTVSLFIKDAYLWMDEVLSYLLLSDPSLAHANKAIVSGMDANPPLFINLYWRLGHWFSLNPLFLKSVSVVLFATTVVWFFRYISGTATRQPLVGTPVANLVVSLLVISFTYLNYTLSTQLRAYSLYLLFSWAYVVVLHQLIHHPRHRWLLLAHVGVGTAFVFTHNVALFYVAASGVFFGLLWLRTRNGSYLNVLGTHALLGAIWLLGWASSFAIQAQAGKPHSWIPAPTFWSFFKTIGDLLPTPSATLDASFPLLTVLRVVLVAGLFLWITLPQLRREGRDDLPLRAFADQAFSLYVLSGFLVGFTLLLALVVSLVYTSVFLNRYFWPSSLLLLYQLIYGGWWVVDRYVQPINSRLVKSWPLWARYVALALFLVGTGTFMARQNAKIPLFSGEVRQDLATLKPGQPVFVESAYYFLPLRFYQARQPICYLLDWTTALDKRNVLESTTDYKILEGVATFYHPSGLLQPSQFNAANLGHFYVVDEASRYQIEKFITSGQVKVHHIIPSRVAGHRILDCTF